MLRSCAEGRKEGTRRDVYYTREHRRGHMVRRTTRSRNVMYQLLLLAGSWSDL